MRAPAELPREVPIVVPIERIDRASLAAIAYALSISWDVAAVHVDTGGIETARIRERWRTCRDGVRLDIVARDVDLAAYLERRDESGIVVVVPTVISRPSWLYPL